MGCIWVLNHCEPLETLSYITPVVSLLRCHLMITSELLYYEVYIKNTTNVTLIRTNLHEN